MLTANEDDDQKRESVKAADIFKQTEEFDEAQKLFVKQILQKYEMRHLPATEFRILQGVLTTNFGNLENQWLMAKDRHDRKKNM